MKTYRLLFQILFIFLLPLTGCKNNPENFIFSYSMESVTNYKVVITVKSDRTFIFEEYNYFFDNAAKKRDPLIISGVLSYGQFNKTKALINKSDIFNLKDAYGFNSESGSFLYQTYLKARNKEKFISMREINTNELPSNYIQLIKYMNNLMSNTKNKHKENTSR